MIDHCYAVSGEINPLFFISSILSLNLCLLLLCIYFKKTKIKLEKILHKRSSKLEKNPISKYYKPSQYFSKISITAKPTGLSILFQHFKQKDGNLLSIQHKITRENSSFQKPTTQKFPTKQAKRFHTIKHQHEQIRTQNNFTVPKQP
jgi:hypothetical protein